MHTPLFRLPSFDLPPPRVAAPHGDDDGDDACGWYASSFELRRGLQVTEHADLDAVVRELAHARRATA
jgi:hypothetical protein